MLPSTIRAVQRASALRRCIPKASTSSFSFTHVTPRPLTSSPAAPVSIFSRSSMLSALRRNARVRTLSTSSGDDASSRSAISPSSPASSSPSPTPSSSSSPSPSPSPSSSPPANAPAWVRVLNEAMALHPVETVVAYVALDIASIGTMYQALLATGMEIPADFALAFAISRLLRRFRAPVDLAVAAVVAKVYPPLTMVRPSQAFGMGPEDAAAASATASTNAPAAGGGGDGGGGGGGFLRRAGRGLMVVIDRYGLAYLVAQRMMVGLVSVFSIFFALRAGVDVQSLLSSYGIEIGGVGTVAGRWAAAACLAAAGFPGVIVGAGFIGRRLGRMRKARSGGA